MLRYVTLHTYIHRYNHKINIHTYSCYTTHTRICTLQELHSLLFWSITHLLFQAKSGPCKILVVVIIIIISSTTARRKFGFDDLLTQSCQIVGHSVTFWLEMTCRNVPTNRGSFRLATGQKTQQQLDRPIWVTSQPAWNHLHTSFSNSGCFFHCKKKVVGAPPPARHLPPAWHPWC